MNDRPRGILSFATLGKTGLIWLLTVGAAAAAPRYATAESKTFRSHFEAFAIVETVSDLPVRAAATGYLAGLRVRPGDKVKAGQILARLQGPEVKARLAEAEAAVTAARDRQTATDKEMTFERERTTAQLTMNPEVWQAEADQARAREEQTRAEVRQRAFRASLVIKAPVAGTVMAANAAEGERVAPGAPVVTIRTDGSLWLTGEFYGEEAFAIRPGMSGHFTPVGGKAVAVKVGAILGAATSGGGRRVSLVPETPQPAWVSGEAGTVILDGAPRTLVAVPTRALILDRGRWWVLVHLPGGDRPREVVPGPARGWQTFLKSGLPSGAQVVVENAYLEFHQGIARLYQVPD